MDNSDELEQTIVDTTSIIQAPSVDHPLPYRIGPYRIKGLLKKGGTSFLYLGVLADSNELIAIKVLSPKFLKHPEIIDHFLKETRIIEMANHPNIIRLFAHGKWEGGLYIAMEFVRGISLRKLILQNILSFKRSLEIVLEIAYALSHLHSHGIVHRDLKPDNILLSEEGGVKVIDFGIARLVREDTKALNRKVMGTPSYMSPEQRENPLEVSYPSDIYSLAIIAYELCLGRLSYGVIQLSLLPKGLRKILTKALMPSPKDRHQSIHEFIEDLNHYIKTSFEEQEEILDLSLKELSDFYEDIYVYFSPQKSRFHQNLLMGLAKPHGILSSHIYSEHLHLADETMGLLVGWPEKKGVQGMFYNAMLKGIIQVLQEKLWDLNDKPIEKIEQFLITLNSLIHKNKINLYSIALLILSPVQNTLHFFSCGPNKLWIQPVGSNSIQSIHRENPYAGSKETPLIHPITVNWNVGDILYLFTSYEEPPFSSEDFTRAIKASYLSTGQSQAEMITKELAECKKTKPHLLPLMVNTLQRQS